MLDRKRILKDPEEARAGIARKGADPGLVDRVLELDGSRRKLADEEGRINADRKATARSISELMKAGRRDDGEKAKERALELKQRLGEVTRAQQEVDAELNRVMLDIPNIPHASVPDGESEEDNLFVKYGRIDEKPAFSFEPRPHWELGERLGILDLPGGATVSGSGFPVFRGAGARLVRSLMTFMIDMHTREHGHIEIWTPCVVNTASMFGTGQLPKFAEEMYRLGKSTGDLSQCTPDELWLAPTAEVPVTNLLRESRLEEAQLPIRYVAYTPCFRREAGAAGKDTRGILRIHQFDKVEMVHFTTPDRSYDHLEEIARHAEAVLEKLGLHYRRRLLCTGDMTFAGAKTYDLELWAPGVGKYLEISSITNFEDFQARRMGLRYRGSDGKMHFVHTLNGSGLAFPRLIVALLETFQQPDGSVAIPGPLVPYLGCEKLERKA